MSTRRRSRRNRTYAVRALVVLAVFVLGLAVGAALDDNPEPGTTTIERSISVVTVTPTG